MEESKKYLEAKERSLRNTFVYVRSYSRESYIYNLQEQENAIVNYANDWNYNILKIFKEENKSGKIFKGSELKEMVEYIKSHNREVKFVIVSDLSRLSTNPDMLKSLKEYFKACGVKLISISLLMARYVGEKPKQSL